MFIVRMGDIVFGFCNVLYSYCFLKFIKMLAIISFVGFECMFCEVYNMEDQFDFEVVECIFNNYGVYLVK